MPHLFNIHPAKRAMPMIPCFTIIFLFSALLSVHKTTLCQAMPTPIIPAYTKLPTLAWQEFIAILTIFTPTHYLIHNVRHLTNICNGIFFHILRFRFTNGSACRNRLPCYSTVTKIRRSSCIISSRSSCLNCNNLCSRNCTVTTSSPPVSLPLSSAL